MQNRLLRQRFTKATSAFFLRRAQHGRAAAIRVAGLRDPGLLELQRVMLCVDTGNCVLQRVLAWSPVGYSANKRAHRFP